MATKTLADYSTIGPMGHHSPPKWWHSQGNKLSPTDHIAWQWQTIESKAAKLVVSRQGEEWLLEWSIDHLGGKVKGSIIVSTTCLKLMFGLQLPLDELTDMHLSRWMAKDYEAEVGLQGQFIRWGRYLNLPHPGTRHSGDPNLSLYVTEEIQEAIHFLIHEK